MPSRPKEELQAMTRHHWTPNWNEVMDAVVQNEGDINIVYWEWIREKERRQL